jgi:hypothetical protein
VVTITITERGPVNNEEVFVSSRSIELDSKKQLTKGRAAKILAREHPELGPRPILVHSGSSWVATEAVEPSEKCSYHFIWRHYRIAEEKAQ